LHQLSNSLAHARCCPLRTASSTTATAATLVLLTCLPRFPSLLSPRGTAACRPAVGPAAAGRHGVAPRRGGL
jgi:hypothetical protein